VWRRACCAWGPVSCVAVHKYVPHPLPPHSTLRVHTDTQSTDFTDRHNSHKSVQDSYTRRSAVAGRCRLPASTRVRYPTSRFSSAGLWLKWYSSNASGYFHASYSGVLTHCLTRCHSRHASRYLYREGNLSSLATTNLPSAASLGAGQRAPRVCWSPWGRSSRQGRSGEPPQLLRPPRCCSDLEAAPRSPRLVTARHYGRGRGASEQCAPRRGRPSAATTTSER